MFLSVPYDIVASFESPSLPIRLDKNDMVNHTHVPVILQGCVKLNRLSRSRL